MKIDRYFLLSLWVWALFFTPIQAAQQKKDNNPNKSAPKEILGYWYPEDRASKVHIYQNAAGDYFARMVWLAEPVYPDGTAKRDQFNPNPELVKRPLLGIIVSWGFAYKGNKVWEGGSLYDAASGKSYSCNVKLIDANTMEIREYMGIPMIGKTVVFKRATM